MKYFDIDEEWKNWMGNEPVNYTAYRDVVRMKKAKPTLRSDQKEAVHKPVFREKNGLKSLIASLNYKNDTQ